MKKGLCCFCAVLLCTALTATAGDLQKSDRATVEVPAKVDQSVIRNATDAKDLAPVQASATHVSALKPIAKAPAGWVPSLQIEYATRGDCDPPIGSGGGTPEGEPDCFDGYVDTYNVGCNDDRDPPEYPTTPIACGETILGTYGNYVTDGSELRDLDWYFIDLTDDPTYVDGVELTLTVRADQPIRIWIVDGTGGCAEGALTTIQTAAFDACVEGSISACVPAGPFFLLAGATDFTGTPCGSQYELTLDCAPCDFSLPECPSDATIAGQRAFGELEDWIVFASSSKFGDYEEPGLKRFENFQGLDTEFTGLSWWGVALIVDEFGDLIECPLDPGTFLVEAYATDPETNRPDLDAGPICSYTVTDTDGLTITDTGLSYGDFTLYQWELPAGSLSPCALNEGWISIQNTDVCSFFWAGSPEGGTIHVLLDEETGETEDVDGDVSYCLYGDTGVVLEGACCDSLNWSPARCFDRDIDDCLEFGQTFFPGVTCADFGGDPACADLFPENACCVGEICLLDLTEANCVLVEGGVWQEGFFCFAEPFADCTGAACPLFCQGDWGMDMLQGSGTLFPSYTSAAGDPVNVSGTEYYSVGTDITKVGWWGVDSEGPSGADCDFEDILDPAAFTITFYDGAPPPGGQPDFGTATPTDVTASGCLTGFGFTGWPGSLKYWSAPIAQPSGSGWVTTQSDAEFMGTDCILWGWSGSGGDGDSLSGFFNTTSFEIVDSDIAICFFGEVVFGACCDLETGVCTDDVAESECLGSQFIFYPGLTCGEVDPCEAVPGACCRPDGTCDVITAAECEDPTYFLGVGTTCEEDCCVPICPPDGTPEGEPTCGFNYEDTFNPGCLADPPIFSSISVGETICGETGIYEFDDPNEGIVGRRDTDWYQFTLSQTSFIEWTAIGDVTFDLFVGEGSCDGFVLSDGVSEGCNPTPVTAVLPAGTYIGFVSVFGAVGDVDCGTPYLLTVTTDVAGACNLMVGGEMICEPRIQPVCEALGGEYLGDGTSCDGPVVVIGDANCDGAVNGFDIDPFVLALTDFATWQSQFPGCPLGNVDTNCDGVVNGFDIDPFVACLTSGGDCSCP